MNEMDERREGIKGAGRGKKYEYTGVFDVSN